MSKPSARATLPVDPKEIMWNPSSEELRRLTEEMFQFRQDPAESTSVVGSAEGREALLRMRRTITQTLIGDSPDPVYAAAKARERQAARSP